jgi:hypothetical protein
VEKFTRFGWVHFPRSNPERIPSSLTYYRSRPSLLLDLEEEKTKFVVVLELILFFIYFNDLYAASNLSKLVFADDTAGLACDKNIDNLVDNANTELKK